MEQTVTLRRRLRWLPGVGDEIRPQLQLSTVPSCAVAAWPERRSLEYDQVA